MKCLIKKITPAFLLSWYHFCLAILAKWLYLNPSKKIIVIGVTGTAGKSSTCYFIAQLLENAGLKVGITTTTLFKIGAKEWLNDKKITMLGRFQTQKFIKEMVKQKCDIAIIETSSEGIKQFRHIGINYDILVFTNLYPEHIESHGSFEKYKQTKGKLFKQLKKTKHKKNTAKTIIINRDDKCADYFLSFEADKKITYGINKKSDITNKNYQINLLGKYNIYNVLAAVAVCQTLNIDKEKITQAIPNLKPLPGRLEFIKNDLGFKIMVDYSFEPKALAKLYETIDGIDYRKLIHIIGSCGGGRDKARRPVLGKMAAKKANIVIITNEDPYDEDPQEIINQVGAGLVPGQDKQILKIIDRRQAIHKALSIAKQNDLVLITGKGAEQAICIANGKKIPWDDRQVVRDELNKLRASPFLTSTSSRISHLLAKR
ncbi:MAG: UDP-N-acetylmuramyl-tripeptide synthetase [Patescibacteria group bacterium]